jgi:type III secretion protein J
MRKALFLFSLLSLCVLFLASCSRRLEAGLNESDAQQIVVLLRENGINATAELDTTQKKDGSSWRVDVQGQSDTVVRAWNILHENGLPRQKVKGLDDVFANAGIIPTAAEEKARLMSGLNGELTRTLDSLPGVVDARVQVVLPNNTPLIEKNQQPPTTASVLIQFRGEQPPLREAEVKSLMAKGVEGLAAENVAVVFKKVQIRTIPEEAYGPFSLNSWIEILVLGFAILASVCSLILLSVSKARKLKIRKLEQQIAAAQAPVPAPRVAA